jgi:D-arabinose 1-dehydrogenase-like Zn-dependent alcohol dehydrogenase
MVESCASCDLCKEGLENYCPGMCQTYSNVFPKDKGANMEKATGHHTNGGYSTDITVNEHFVFNIPDGKRRATLL